jgi:predicted DNA-binding transcriptional regulator AlpA
MSTTQHPSSLQRQPRKQRGHTLPKAPLISLDQPGWLRVGNLLAILGVSHTTFYSGIASGRYPRPCKHDGRNPVWKTSAIKAFLDA